MTWGQPKTDDDPYWAERGLVWVEIAPGRKRLVDMKKPPALPPARSHMAAPAIMRDRIEPCWGPDGKLHDSLSSYRRSLLPENNPQGERYIEIGNDRLPDYTPPPIDRQKRRDDIRAGIEDVKKGRVPPIVYGDDPL